MNNLISSDLRIEAVDGGPGGPLLLHWTGKSTDRFPTRVLGPYFAQVLGLAAQQASPVEMHFEHLDHFNSSTVTAIIQLIRDAREKNVPLCLVYDQAQKWQRLSFDALRVLSKADDLFRLRSV